MQSRQKLTYAEITNEAISWLVNSGIQIKSDNQEISGGVASWHDEKTRTKPYLYSEITGYALTLLTWLYSQDRDNRYLECARNAAQWLMQPHIRDKFQRGYRCLMPLEESSFDYKHDKVYTFDCGIILNGLVNLFRVTQDERYLEEAMSAGDWLIRETQNLDGSVRPVFDLAKSEWLTNDEEWSMCSGPFHCKIGIGLVNLFEATGELRYRMATERLCDYAMGLQLPDGRFVTSLANNGTNMHAHAYAAEGLWAVGTLLDRQDYLQSSKDATQWLFRMQLPDGRVPRHFYNSKPVYHVRVDVLLQALRLAKLHARCGELSELPPGGLEKLTEVILKYRAEQNGSLSVRGAFYFGNSSKGHAILHVNTWVTLFAIQTFKLLASAGAEQSVNPHFFV